jgi:hypothetical protein
MGLIARWIEMRRIKREPDLFLSKEMMKKAAAELGKTTFEPYELTFILLELRDSDPERAARDILGVRRIAHEYGGISWHFISSIGLIVFLFRDKPADLQLAQFDKCANALVIAHGENIRLIYGQRPAVMAQVFEEPWSHLGPIIPNFSSLLSQLVALPFGSVAEAKIPNAAP